MAFSREKTMQVISAKAAQQHLETICEQVYQNHEPYIVKRENHHNVVILSRYGLFVYPSNSLYSIQFAVLHSIR